MPQNPRLVRGLPRHIDSPVFMGRSQPAYKWDHSLPGVGTVSPQYVPSLGLMACVGNTGAVQLRDPVTTEVIYDYLLAGPGTDALLSMCYVPTANRIVVPIYANTGGNQIALINLNNGRTIYIGSLSFGTTQAAYNASNDLVYVTAYAGPTVYIVDPWLDALHTTPAVTGTFGAVLTSIAYCPLNGKCYAVSRTANNAYRILGTAIDNTFATGGAYDEIFYSDNLRKMVIMAASTGLAFKTIDPLASDTVATLAAGSATALSGVSIPTTGETVVVDSSQFRFFDQAGTNTTNLAPSANYWRGAGWNPITKTVWFQSNNPYSLMILDPVKKDLNTAMYIATVRVQ